jgi:threonine dehydratase
LIAGIAFALKTLYPSCKVIGVQPKVSAPLAKSLKAHENIHVGKFKTIADALVASKLGKRPFAIIEKYIDDCILIEEEKIKMATRFMLENHKLVTEPAAALPIAAIFEGVLPNSNIVCIITGGNIDLLKYMNMVKE